LITLLKCLRAISFDYMVSRHKTELHSEKVHEKRRVPNNFKHLIRECYLSCRNLPRLKPTYLGKG